MGSAPVRSDNFAALCAHSPPDDVALWAHGPEPPRVCRLPCNIGVIGCTGISVHSSLDAYGVESRLQAGCARLVALGDTLLLCGN